MRGYSRYAALVLVCSVVIAVDVEKTVKQVQNILQANEGLPRLSRDEIIQLLNDIRSEDSKSKSSSTESSREIKTSTPSIEENEINPESQTSKINKDIHDNDKNANVPASTPATVNKATTKILEPSVMVVLPYTPRDGSSLQELYTRPPRVEVLPASKVTPSPLISSLEKLQRTLTNNAKTPQQPKDDITAELQAFLESHGLKGKPGQDNFLLPIDGFKPLPPAKVIDGTVQLPENILLTYDLISSNTDTTSTVTKMPPINFLYEPLRPEFPFELDTSPSEPKKIVLPLDMPVRNIKTTTTTGSLPKFEPIDYETVRVIPLNKGINPAEDIKAEKLVDQNKRQANESTITLTTTIISQNQTITDASNTDKKANDSPALDSAASDTGASITDLEESFGGAAPVLPGDSELPPPRKNGFYWMLDWNSFLEVGDGDTKVNIRFEPKLGDPQMFIPVNVP